MIVRKKSLKNQILNILEPIALPLIKLYSNKIYRKSNLPQCKISPVWKSNLYKTMVKVIYIKDKIL